MTAPIPMTLEQIARRQRRYAHLCQLLGVQDRPGDSDGYTAAEWDAYKTAQAEAADRRAADARM